MKTALIIGGGPAGCSAAHLLTLAGGWDITLVEKASLLGGGIRTHYYGGHPYTFGPRHFLTENEKTYEYLNKYCPLRDCSDHEFLTYIEKDEAFYHFPINKADIPKMPDRDQIYKEMENAELAKANLRFSPAGELLEGTLKVDNLEDFWIASVGPTLYEKFVKYYTQKMWMIEDNQVIDNFGWSPKGVTIKDANDKASWSDVISAYPYAPDGYNSWFDIATEEANVLLETVIDVYDIPNKAVSFKGEKHSYDLIINTISPDIVMNFAYGDLPFIGRDLIKFVLPLKRALPDNIYFLYYANQESYTRIVEYKKLTRQNWDSPTTLLSLEIPSKNGRYYPLPLKSEIARAQKYFDDMPDNVFSIGRAGSYDYGVDIDDSIEQVMDIIEKVS